MEAVAFVVLVACFLAIGWVLNVLARREKGGEKE